MKKFLVLPFVAIALGLTGCASTQMYAKNKSEGVYFTVPNGWKKISQKDLAKRESESKAAGAADRLSLVSWQEAYSKGGEAKPEDVFSLKAPQSPLVYVRVRNLSPEEVQSVSYNSLRDIIVPLTDWISKGNESQNFVLENDFEEVKDRARGVHEIFSFTGLDGVDQTINQIALVSDDRTKLYVLLIRANSKDFQANNLELKKIADSFTIRAPK